MAFEVEDGTGLPTATSYTSVEFADGYATDRGLDPWMALNLAQKQRSLIQATDYIDKNFRFRGVKRTQTQSLVWPRWDVVDTDGWGLVLDIPPDLQKATVEYAVRAASAELQPDPAQVTTAGWIKEVEERVGTLLERTRYEGGGVAQGLQAYPAADALLSRLVKRGGIQLERA